MRWVAAGVFAVLAVLQAVKWGTMGMAIQGPLLLILVLGLVVAGFRDALPFRNHALFVCAYGAVFLLMWAVGNPGIELVVGRTWMVTVGGLLVLAGAMVWNLRGKQDFRWMVAFVGSVGFGLAIAYLCGPEGGPDWMLKFYMKVLGLHPHDWAIGMEYVKFTRKSLHFLGYGMAALCTAVMVFRVKRDIWRAVLMGIAWPLPIAIFDEMQQRMSSVRTGQISDVVLDFSGMVVFLAGFVWWNKRKEGGVIEE